MSAAVDRGTIDPLDSVSQQCVANPTRYDGIAYPRCGVSGLCLSRISLGLWNNFGADRTFETQRAIVLRAFDNGVTHFDLANNYGPPPGAAEAHFGRIIARDLRPYRDELIVSSKAGYDMWPGPYGQGGSRKHVLASLDQSLARLGLDYVDVFYSHRFDPRTPLEETMGALATAVRSGRAHYVGISNYDADQTRRAAAILDELGIALTVHQPRYNIFDRTPQRGLFQALAELKVGAVAFSPLAGGLLTDRYLSGAVPAGSRAAEGRWFDQRTITGEYLDSVRGLHAIAAERGQSLAQLAIAWVLRAPQVTSALVGASSVGQLENTLKALDNARLDTETLARIDALASG
jgi:L-glyceraldehyde 3-phosphate reductase